MTALSQFYSFFKRLDLKSSYCLIAVGGVFLLPLTALAETLTWQDFQNQVQSKGFTLRQERLDVDIAKAAIGEAKSKYLPNVNLQINSERLETLTNRPLNSANTPNIGGNTFILNRDAIQHSAGLNSQWLVLDFGKRKAQVEQNKAAAEAETYDVINKQYRLLLRALPLYAQLWQWQQEQGLQAAQLKLNKEKLAYIKRLYEAGKIGKLALYEAEMKVLSVQETLDRLSFSIVEGFQQLQLQSQLKLSEPYPQLAIDFAMPEQENDVNKALDPSEASFEQSAHVKELDSRIRQKEQEMIQIKRQRWTPDLSVYGTLVAFGTDQSSLPQSLSNITWRNARIGWSLQMPLTQALALNSSEKKVKLEKERLLIEKEASLWEAQETDWQLKEQARVSAAREKQLKASEAMLQNIQAAANRLKVQGVLTPLEGIDVAIKSNQQQLDRIKWQSEQWIIQEKKALFTASLVTSASVQSQTTQIKAKE